MQVFGILDFVRLVGFAILHLWLICRKDWIAIAYREYLLGSSADDYCLFWNPSTVLTSEALL